MRILFGTNEIAGYLNDNHNLEPLSTIDGTVDNNDDNHAFEESK